MRCLKPLSLSERRPEHFLTMLERRAENMTYVIAHQTYLYS